MEMDRSRDRSLPHCSMSPITTLSLQTNFESIKLPSIRSLFANNSSNHSTKSIRLRTTHPGNINTRNRPVVNAGFASLDDQSLPFFIDVTDRKGLLASYRTASKETNKDGPSQTEVENGMLHAVIHVPKVHATSRVVQRS